MNASQTLMATIAAATIVGTAGFVSAQASGSGTTTQNSAPTHGSRNGPTVASGPHPKADRN